MLSNNEKALSLKEASKYAGLSVCTLRRFIKSGKFEQAYRREGRTGSQWVIPKVELDRLKGVSKDPAKPEQNLGQRVINEDAQSILIPLAHYEERRKEWDGERLSLHNELITLRTGLEMYRFKFEELDRKIKLLPAPVEVVTAQLQETEEALKAEVGYREQLRAALQEREDRLQEQERQSAALQAKLEQARRPWWKKLMGVK